jgi:deoxyribose-phosphate aldolase
MNQYIDHTNLKPTAQEADIITLCQEANQYEFKSVCVHGGYVSLCVKQLKDTPVKVCAVVGFPLGANTVESKAFEASNAIDNGATEVDMVINISKVIEGNKEYLVNEIAVVKKAVGNNILKVIIEACLLNDEQKVLATQCVVDAKADFVKTSTGFSTSGATVEDVKLLSKTANKQIEVKAAGGVKTYADLEAMIEAGATRIGTSSGIALLKGKQVGNNY